MISKKASVRTVQVRNHGTELFPIKIRVTFERLSRFYPAKTTEKISVEDFLSRRTKVAKIALENAERCAMRAADICDNLGPRFSFPEFEKQYFLWYNNGVSIPDRNSPSLVSDVLDRLLSVSDLSESSRSLYRITGRWIERYSPKADISSVDTSFITGFTKFIKEKRLEESGTEMSENTVRIYLRNLKALLNFAIDKGYREGPNPLKQVKRQPLVSIPRQKASLRESDFAILKDYVPVTKEEAFAKDFFLATIQTSGANLVDILGFRNSNVNGDEISFIRTKTKRSGLITTVPLTKDLRSFFCKYGKLDKSSPDNYILPFLAGAKSAKTIKNRTHTIDKKINDGLKSICEHTGIEVFTLYTARHTFAVYARAHHLGIEAIQRFLGHANFRTTQIYLSSITDSEKRKNREFLEEIGG